MSAGFTKVMGTSMDGFVIPHERIMCAINEDDTPMIVIKLPSGENMFFVSNEIEMAGLSNALADLVYRIKGKKDAAAAPHSGD